MLKKIFSVILCLGLGLNSAFADLVPAAKYSGKILNGSEVTNNACQFYIAINPLESAEDSEFALVYSAGVHGEALPPGMVDFFYFDASAPLGSNFYDVGQPQDQNTLTMSSILLRPSSPKYGSEVSPNDLAELNKNGDIQTSMILNFAPGVSHEKLITALYNLASDPTSAPDLDTLSSTELMTVLLWHSGHYDRARCGNVSFDAFEFLDLEFANPFENSSTANGESVDQHADEDHNHDHESHDDDHNDSHESEEEPAHDHHDGHEH